MKQRILTKDELDVFFNDTKFNVLFLIMYEAQISHLKVKKLTYKQIIKDEWLIDNKKFIPSQKLKELIKNKITKDNFKKKLFLTTVYTNVYLKSLCNANNINPDGVSTFAFAYTSIQYSKYLELKKLFD